MKYLTRMHIRYIFFISLILTQQSACRNSNHIILQQATPLLLSTVSPDLQKADEGEIKISKKKENLLPSDGIQQSRYHYTTGSCVDRCHVNFMKYQTMYHDDYFRHRNHSPEQGMECNLCHENYVDDTKPHGDLIIQNKNCVACHHKDASNNDCLKCHAEVKEYMDGSIQAMITKIPDWMSAAVSCKECHKLELDGSSFETVRNKCVECHSSGYGVLFDLWKKMLDSEIKQYYENEEGNIQNAENRNQISNFTTSLLTEQINTTAEFLFKLSPHLKRREAEEVKYLPKKRPLQLDVTNRPDLLRFIESYGMHNILLSQLLLKFIGNEQQYQKR